ncbi:MAG: hypothetical protein A3I44_00940 [Candidatus Sungbacteria bacterium RIFCSPLOWO2_02_FULL_51_17]|uniref:Uncharacterized protein n=1 Tax=Candidatus Sungbacteria bacterium RIFCSPHIGHO2_02_FULL_51_29 TaxID=1802273 RepID=A0A1G2KXB4_9BACT|nr:MAG: hypothetical protein A2676_00050 [Candidatus Sungbacteria bacterium RIFCSPHIGHO2_01_FULL_51_22]OHA04048.1 MAG: hypothetical protein A3C16_04285 [Candidatus Sungbacteria bacterium RIFCSPHIGHO2_02_FULL_51_29]OHA06867.1 MAG: hypothetical protein A3B29_01615 [Candidatus Sungbacteria bacterium RIFCSPLOWO2_01_FULL_51_34]OHA10686.1 MAG: hypothetical protein A3I44_00940 [Candidatus Sungbacteria bacterium RIFCSPLOWO2_02_FULL_51_17]
MWNETKQLIQKAQRIGVMLPLSYGIDEFAAGLVLKTALTALGKTAVFTREVLPPKQWHFLLSGTSEPAAPGECVLSIPIASSPIKQIRYETDAEFVHIVLTPRNAEIKKEDVRVHARTIEYDLIITIGIPGPEHFGKEFEEHPPLFYKNPIINIDISPKNDRFATINAVNVRTSSLSELVYELLTDELDADIRKEDASWLLAGIIERTENFCGAGTTPSSLEVASFLLEVGADKDAIIRARHKTVPLPLLQLWGRAAIRSRFDEKTSLLWTFVPATDFLTTNTSPEDISFVLAKFKEYFQAPRAFVTLYEHPQKKWIETVLAPIHADLAERMREHKELREHATGFLHAKTPKTFLEAEERVHKLLGELS